MLSKAFNRLTAELLNVQMTNHRDTNPDTKFKKVIYVLIIDKLIIDDSGFVIKHILCRCDTETSLIQKQMISRTLFCGHEFDMSSQLFVILPVNHSGDINVSVSAIYSSSTLISYFENNSSRERNRSSKSTRRRKSLRRTRVFWGDSFTHARVLKVQAELPTNAFIVKFLLDWQLWLTGILGNVFPIYANKSYSHLQRNFSIRVNY